MTQSYHMKISDILEQQSFVENLKMGLYLDIMYANLYGINYFPNIHKPYVFATFSTL